MRIPFRKISSTPHPVTFSLEEEESRVALTGTLIRKDGHNLLLEGVLEGIVTRPCDGCGQTVEQTISESLSVILHEGMYHPGPGDRHHLLEEPDLWEVTDGVIDLEELIRSEIAAVQCDYYWCPECTDNEQGEKNGSTKA